MKVITDIGECNNILKNYKRSIIDSYGYKEILNTYYKPDSFLFFVDGQDLIPLIIKNNLVTFYGGTKYYQTNSLPNNKKLINYMLLYLEDKGYSFQLLSLNKDYFSLLNPLHKHLDVPYPTEWHYKDIQNYDQKSILNSFHRKKKWEFNRALKESIYYTFQNLTFSEFKSQYPHIIKSHIDYFLSRGKKSSWEGNENLLLELLYYFEQEEKLVIRLIKFENDIVGINIHIYNSKEIIYFFASSLNAKDRYISKIMYFDALETARKLSEGTNISQLNATRGTFTNKKRFGLTPIPLYALVKDDNWIFQVDKDIIPEQYEKIYGRSTWGREK